MRIDRVYLENFRNYAAQTVTFHPACNVICGENAQGKTNLLEALVYLACGRSPRARTDREMIGFDASAALLQGEIFSREREFVSRLEVRRGRRKAMSVNKVPAKTASALSAVLGTIFFSPEDLQLIRAGAAERRRFLDASLSQLRPRYAAALSEYQRLHEHKTRILRDCADRPDLLATLPDFNRRMAETGAVLIHYRSRFVRHLARHAASAYSECSGGRERLQVSYQTVRTVTDPLADERVLVMQLVEHQRAHHYAEVSSRQCLSGPHKDDMEVLLDGLSAKSFASQGQTRTAALALKLAARELHQELLGEYPVLLLDDVLSELDPKRQEFVLNRIGGGQIFITCCEEDRLHTLLQGNVYRIQAGRVAGREETDHVSASGRRSDHPGG